VQGTLRVLTPRCAPRVAQVPDVNDKRYQPGPPAAGEEEAVRLPSQVHENPTAACAVPRVVQHPSGTEGPVI
jgi:hypothetical protein